MKARCYESHKPLSLGGGLVIYGGSCGHPVVKDADVYVGLDYSMEKSDMMFPWVPGVAFQYLIPDMKAPTNPKSFSDLIDWLILQVTANKKVHIGCIGGHGRTGTVLAALVSRMLGRKDAIQYVRENYCQKAVESLEQVRFLMEHYGVSEAVPAKAAQRSSQQPLWDSVRPSGKIKEKPDVVSTPVYSGGTHAVSPLKTPSRIWSSSVVFDKRPDSGIIAA